jgi:hypothetical protein
MLLDGKSPTRNNRSPAEWSRFQSQASLMVLRTPDDGIADLAAVDDAAVGNDRVIDLGAVDLWKRAKSAAG